MGVNRGSLTDQNATQRFFWFITAKPILVMVAAVLFVLVAGAGLTTIVKDTSVKAFIPPSHPSLLADAKATEIFGLSDAIAIALVSTDKETIFQPDKLAVLARLAEQVAALPNVRADRVASLASESSISGSDGEVFVDMYIESEDITEAQAEDARLRWLSMPPHQGTLVSLDGTSAVIMAELIDTDAADQTYASVLALGEEMNLGNLEMHIAGPGAVSGLLSKYIDNDARMLQPLVFLLVLSFIYMAFRRASALPGPLLVVLGAVGGSLGIMAWAGTPYYAITNSLPVIVVAISVADAIHILSAYYEGRSTKPGAPAREIVVNAMTEMARPITLTTITTIAGFIGITAVSIMPPIIAFAWYAALGVLLAWIFSIIVLPNLLILTNPGPSPAFKHSEEVHHKDIGDALAMGGVFAAKHCWPVLAAFVIVSSLAVWGATHLRVDRSQVDNFEKDAPIRIADELINETFSGTAFLDVIIETDEEEGLLSAERMAKISAMQDYIEQLPHVQKTVGITDYLSLLDNAIEARIDNSGKRNLPTTDDAIAQYLLIYEVSGDPADLEEEIDIDYKTALIRTVLNVHYFSQDRQTVEALQQYIVNEFNETGMTASLAGNVNITYHWMNSLQKSHFSGVALSLAMVLVTSIIVFRSLGAGIVALVPVCFAVLVLYAFMGMSGIYLEPATSMFAAIALGVGVDFAIHLVDKLREALAMHDGDLLKAIEQALPTTARACYFNSMALALGFSILMASDLPTLQRFGGLIAVATMTSFITALIIVPAMFAAGRTITRNAFMPKKSIATSTVGAIFVLASLSLIPQPGFASESASTDATAVVQQVFDREEGSATRRELEILVTDRRDKTRTREALILKRKMDDGRQTRITYLSPKSVRDVAFLSHDYFDSATSDDRWLYMPATRKARRLPASDRGDYFLGTDFTYEDIQSELKYDPAEYTFEYIEQTVVEGVVQHRVSGTPVTEELAGQLGFSRVDILIDSSNWMPLEANYYDANNELKKTILVQRVEVISGIATATQLEAIDHQQSHKTLFTLTNVTYPDELPEEVFDSRGLTRGLPASMLD